jgi:hypothetical protein
VLVEKNALGWCETDHIHIATIKVMIKTKAEKNKARRARKSKNALLAAQKKWFVDSAGFSTPLGALSPFSFGSGDPNSAPKKKNQRMAPRNRQPTTQVVGTGVVARNRQVTMPRVVQRRLDGEDMDVLIGTELVHQLVTSSTGNAPGDIIYSQILHPSHFPASRLLQFSNLYEKYQFLHGEFIFEAAVGTQNNGSLIGFFDYDADNILEENSFDNVRLAAAKVGNHKTAVWTNASWAYRAPGKMPDFFLASSSTGDQRLVNQGVFYIIALTALPASLSLGTLTMDYQIKLVVPSLLSPSGSIASPFTQSYYNAGTTAIAQSTVGSAYPFLGWSLILGSGGGVPYAGDSLLTVNTAVVGANDEIIIPGLGNGWRYAITVGFSFTTSSSVTLQSITGITSVSGFNIVQNQPPLVGRSPAGVAGVCEYVLSALIDVTTAWTPTNPLILSISMAGNNIQAGSATAMSAYSLSISASQLLPLTARRARLLRHATEEAAMKKTIEDIERRIKRLDRGLDLLRDDSRFDVVDDKNFDCLSSTPDKQEQL